MQVLVSWALLNELSHSILKGIYLVLTIIYNNANYLTWLPVLWNQKTEST